MSWSCSSFTKEFSQIPAEEFVERVLVNGVHAVHAVMGTNFTFGHRAAGTVDNLPELGAPFGLTAEGVELVEVHGARVSSSSIRDALAAGDLDVAAASRSDGGSSWTARSSPDTAAARDSATPRRTSGRGHGSCSPGKGSTPGVAELAGGRLGPRSTSGTNPTFGTEPLHAEAFLLDYDGDDLRGEPLAIEFWERLRDEVRYDSVDELVAAIADDVERTREIVPAAEPGG